MTLLIGLMGKARSGKDTAADALQREFNLHRYAFADPLKDMLEVVFGDKFRKGDREQPIEWLGRSPRQLMQTLGTEWGRDMVHPDLWQLLAHQRWLAKQAAGQGMVVSDVRFPNEVRWVQEQGGLIIEIVRPGVEPVNSHVSETALSLPILRCQVLNIGTVELLQSTVVSLVKEWSQHPESLRMVT